MNQMDFDVIDIPHTGMTERQYLELCRQKYREKCKDLHFEVGASMTRITQKCHPNDTQAAYQLRNAISRLIRTKFNIRGLYAVNSLNRNDVLRFLNDIERLLCKEDTYNA